MRVSRKLAFGAWVGSLAWLGGCSDGIGPPPPLPTGGLVLSDPTPNEPASLARVRGIAFRVAGQVTQESDVTYISLPSGSYASGAFARIQSSGFTGVVTAPMVEGGLDPVPIPAAAGDSIELEILSSGLVLLARTGGKVPTARRPRVVRTVPPRGKTDVAVNAVIVAVFSEPVDPATLATTSVQLFRGTAAVAGTVRSLDGVTAAAVFEPSAALEPNAEYRLVVTQAVKDLAGEPLEAEETVTFTTGSTALGTTYSVSVLPDASVIAIGSQVQLTATARDTLGRIISGRPITWTSQNPTVATVSATGLVTGLASGLARVRADIDGRTAVAVIDVSGSLEPVASVQPRPQQSTVVVNGYVQLTALLRDASGSVVRLRPVTWGTDAPGVATVTAGPEGTALVTGVSPGTATIMATSEGRTGTATITVGTVGPYARIAAHFDHTCALTTAGTAWCWGKNGNLGGALGNGTSLPAHVPTAVAGELTFSQIAPGLREFGGCALTPDRAAYCWGFNGSGELGIGSFTGPEQCGGNPGTPCSNTPVAVTGAHRFSQIAVTGSATCALTETGAAYCWGDHQSGLLGSATTSPQLCGEDWSAPFHCSPAPVAVASGLTYTAITLGGLGRAHACALAVNGAAYCWGENGSGQLGDSTTRDRVFPTPVAGGLAFVALSAGYDRTCGLTSDGTAYCWGENSVGQLGIGGSRDALGNYAGPESCPQSPCTVPVPVATGLRWASISSGRAHTCAVTAAGVGYCWGIDNNGVLGTGSKDFVATTPVAVAGGLGFASVSAALAHTCGVTTAGVAYCWGNNWTGQLGDGTRETASALPVRVAGQP